MRLQIFAEHDHAPQFNKRDVAFLVRRILKDEGKNSDNINVILTGDDHLLEVNRRFLNHNYKTDVISFELGERGIVDGEIYISLDRAKIQAKRYGVPLEKEVLRLIIHGVLHLAGWEDATRSQKLRMRKRENALINALN